MKIIGDGGHASVVRSILRHSFSFKDWLVGSSNRYFVAVGDNAARKREVEKLNGAKYLVIRHPSSVMEPPFYVGEGTVIMAGVIVQTGARIGKHVILNTGCTVDHGCVIKDYAHIAPGAHLCGGVHVGEGALVGVGVGIEPGAKIPAWSIVKREKYVITLPSN